MAKKKAKKKVSKRKCNQEAEIESLKASVNVLVAKQERQRKEAFQAKCDHKFYAVKLDYDGEIIEVVCRNCDKLISGKTYHIKRAARRFYKAIKALNVNS